MKFKPEMLRLLASTAPFLNTAGQQVIATTQHMAELIESPAGVQAFTSLGALNQGETAQTTGETVTGGGNPFTLFLVFYLLILSLDRPRPHRATAPGEEDAFGLPAIMPALQDLAAGETSSSNP